MNTAESNAQQQQSGDKAIADLIAEQKQSGLSIAAFARQHGIPVWKLYQAGRSRRRRRTAKRPDLVEIAVRSKAPDALPLELLLPSDLRIRIPQDFDESTLRRILGVLTSC